MSTQSITISKRRLRQLLNRAFLEGFNESGEGFNGEYPFRDKGTSPEDDDEFMEPRNKAVNKMMEEL